MARSVPPSILVQRLRKLTNTQRDTHIEDSELYEYLSSAVAEVWDKIVASGIGTEYVKKVAFNTVADQLEYSIGTILGATNDFYKVSQLYVNEGSGQLRPIERIHQSEIQAYRAPQSAVPMQLNYVPVAPVWDGVSDTAFDGINGWEELVLVIAAQAVKAKKNDSASWFVKRQRELEQRLVSMNNRNVAGPARVVRRRRAAQNDRYSPWRNNVSRWDIRGDTLLLYYHFGSEL